jgi:hypothetical protein
MRFIALYQRGRQAVFFLKLALLFKQQRKLKF